MPFVWYLLALTYSFLLVLVRLAGIEPARPKARDFKSLVSTYFTTVAFVGVPPGTRTPTNSFGDCHAAITLEIHKKALAVTLEFMVALLFMAGPCAWSTLTSFSVFHCSYSASIDWRK